METKETIIAELGLTVSQSEIMYNLERLKTQADSLKEDDEQKRFLKSEWLQEWSGQIDAIFQKNAANDGRAITWFSEADLYEAVSKEVSAAPNKMWYYLSVLEAEFFVPYFPLEVKEETGKNGKKKIIHSKKYKGIKWDKSEWLKEYIAAQGIIEAEFIERIRKAYKKSHDRLTGRINKLIYTGLGMAAVTALTFAVAALAAPAIAVLLVGPQFAGLHGIALINACLAFLGGGAIAVGGAGIAGGTALIAGGGAVLGLTVSAAGAGGAHALGVFSNPDLALSQTARLEVTMKEIILNSQHDTRLAQVILERMTETVKELNNRLIDLELDAKANKDDIGNLKKCIDMFKKSRDEMLRFSSSFAEGTASEGESEAE